MVALQILALSVRVRVLLSQQNFDARMAGQLSWLERMIHNHEVPSSILGPATRKHSIPLCFFCFQTLKPSRRGRHYCNSHRKFTFTVAVVVMDAVSEAIKGLRVPQTKIAYGYARLSWVPCERTERIRRRRQATKTSWVPLQESTAETLCFFRFLSEPHQVDRMRNTIRG